MGKKSRLSENSIEKDEFTNIIQTTLPDSNVYAGRTLEKERKTGKQKLHYNNNNNNTHTRKDLRSGAVTDMVKRNDRDAVRVKKNDVRIKIISDSHSRENGSSTKERCKNNISMTAGQQLKLTVESLDNNSFSNMTASTYCNGNSSLLDDGGLSNFGDGEDSSIVSGMIVSSSSNNNAQQIYSRRPSNLARQRDDSKSELSSINRMESPTTFERDLEIMDMLERRRSMDVHEPSEREQVGEALRINERRRLPDIEKIFNRLPKAKMEAANFFDMSTDTSITAVAASTSTACDTAQMMSTATAGVSPHDPLTTDEAYSSGTTLNSQMSFNDEAQVISDEEVPQDFFDDYTPGSEGPKIPIKSEYQYSRRQSRKTPHFGSQIMGSHRTSKRDSFNSLNGSDLIAGAFGELDPTQPLTKMSVIESRMRRSSGRSSNFSTTARSTMRSRDLNSTHTMHPELDFRENIFAEL